MLSYAENERLTKVGPGTPCGDLYRRYWLPVSPAESLDHNPVVPVRILGESLVLFRDRRGRLGLIDERCPHRQTSLALGIPEQNGLRCCYHGWLFDAGGRCLEMPLEPADSPFKSKVSIRAYPVQAMGGLIWAYLGPAPAPVLPTWDIYVRPGALRQMIGHHIPTNWLQVVENQADPGHLPYGHGRFFQYALERENRLSSDPRTFYNASFASADALQARGEHTVYRALPNELGYTVARKLSGEPDTVPGWNSGAGAMLFPTMLSSGPGDIGTRVRRWCQVVVPLDDHTTWQLQYFAYFFPEGVAVPAQSAVPYTQVPIEKSDGTPILDYALGQDIAIFQGQGVVADRSKERLGVSDAIVVAYRKMLREQIDRVAAGQDPINVFRSADAAQRPDLRLPGNETAGDERKATGMIMEGLHKTSDGGRLMIDDVVDRYNRDRETIIALFAEAERVMAANASRA